MFIQFAFSGAPPQNLPSPFNTEPHAWAKQAAMHLQEQLSKLKHPFGFGGEPEATGKMFGVLVVRDNYGRHGYLAAFSGKLDGSNHHIGFVPPVFDILEEHGFYRKGEEELNAINRELEELERNPIFIGLRQDLNTAETEYAAALAAEKRRAKLAKQERDTLRFLAHETQLAALIKASKQDHYRLRDLKKYWTAHIDQLKDRLLSWEVQMQQLRDDRKMKSATLQSQIFSEYTFLNGLQKPLGLEEIFRTFNDSVPPAGAGECAGPKLFQYAWKHQMEPLAITEFWWGISPPTEVRKHGQFYPACRGKCLPILSHMLVGSSVQMVAQTVNYELKATVLFEDEFLAILSKPAGMLSVPGKEVEYSVQSQARAMWPTVTGPLIVHRLDQATSGLMLIAKTEQVYKILQAQFIGRSVQKRYIAILSAPVSQDAGVIDLPLRVDLDDRPRQMVCDTFGKSARTHYRVLERWPNGCKVEFRPVTGRTHQLRVHAAHARGLHAPIKGDDLYGTSDTRLHLHAEELSFLHPITSKEVSFKDLAPW